MKELNPEALYSTSRWCNVKNIIYRTSCLTFISPTVKRISNGSLVLHNQVWERNTCGMWGTVQLSTAWTLRCYLKNITKPEMPEKVVTLGIPPKKIPEIQLSSQVKQRNTTRLALVKERSITLLPTNEKWAIGFSLKLCRQQLNTWGPEPIEKEIAILLQNSR